MTQRATPTNRPMPGCLVAGLLVAMSLLFPVSAQAVDLDIYLTGIRIKYGLPAIAAAVVKNGEIVSAAAVGTRILGEDIPVTIDDRFHIGSNTKAMTATLAGMLVEEGKLRWDSRVGEILGDDVKGMSASLANATLEQLLSHSSGIPSDNETILDLYFSADVFDHNLTDLRLRLLNAWKNNEISVPDGSPFQYSNLGYVIAGMMIEEVTGTPWEQLMRQRIFTPLEMRTAGLGPQATYGRVDAPVGHRIEPDGSVTPMLWGPAADVPQVIAPAGNAHMSISDYAKWAGWNAGKGGRGPVLVSPETLHHLQSVKVQTPVRDNPPPGTPATGGYGLGWGTVSFDWADRPLLTHNGSNSMNLARIVIDPEQDLAIVVTTNFPGAAANTAAGAVLQHLYATYTR
ncbi:serine hydrolase domain-containing protein [Roseibium salinum]|uniref:Serine hydrolase n=1 Tax=Roseibium salinum TaxID=1604349 RepID=A0ABT3R0L1_9HYPH|nr:serine hydrolase domain-containing protein [Roseibium sp. DSM 29163]MCX2722751.1 serine hydrolase [Roseibium sp. DSM 29163]